MRNRIFGIALLSTAALGSIQPAYAQSSGPGENVAGETVINEADPGDIVVTARRREERLQDVPVAVSVVSGDSLSRANITNLEQLAARLPNVKISQAPASDQLYIRGVGSGLNLGFEQSVGTFVDGLYRGRSRASRAAFFDIERVEVLKGPQTTYFGNSAIAGALNITTKKPGSSLEANGSVFYAPATDEYLVEGGISVPVTETLSGRLAVRASGNDGYIRNTTDNSVGPRMRDVFARASVAWQPSDSWTSNVRVDFGRLRDDGVYNAELMHCPPPPEFTMARGACARYVAGAGAAVDSKLDYRSTTSPSYLNYDYTEAAFSNQIEIGSHQLTLITGYFDHDYDYLIDVVPVPAQFGSVVGTTSTFPSRIMETFSQFSQEIRLSSDFDGPVQYTVGGYYSHGKLKVDSFFGLYFARFGALSGGTVPPATPVAVRVQNHIVDDNYSAFAMLNWQVTDKLKINLGGRYTVVDKRGFRETELGAAASIPGFDNFVPASVAGQAALMPLTGIDAGNYVRRNRSDDQFMPSANIQYNVGADFMIYASASKGFKSGGYSVLLSKSDFAPETVKAFELGLKSKLFDRKLTLNIAAYLSKYDDLQETTTIFLPSGAAASAVANVARSTAKGVEANAVLRVTPNLSLSADVSYLSSIYDSYPNAPCTALQALAATPCRQDLSGKRRAFAPEFSGNVGANFTHPFTKGTELRIDTTAYFSTSYYQQSLADIYLSQGGFTKLDARLAIAANDDRWEIAVVGKNLTNKLTASFRNGVPSSPGTILALTDPKRSIGFQANVKF